MSNLRVSTPKFFIDAVLLARQWGMIETENANGFYYLNPSNIKSLTFPAQATPDMNLYMNLAMHLSMILYVKLSMNLCMN